MSAALVLAAGEGRRFGGGPKQLAEVAGRPLIEHALAAVRTASAAPSSCSARAPRRSAPAPTSRGAEVVVCPDWAEGMGASLRHGLAALGDADEVVDRARRPAVHHVARWSRACAPRPGRRRAPSTTARPGHPVVLRAAAARARRRAAAATAASATLLDGVVEVECGDLADPRDIDTRADLEVVRR